MAARRRASGRARDGRARRAAGHGEPRASHAYNGEVRGQVSDLQRARIVSAMFEVCAQRGAANVTVAHIVERSGVSRRTFYELFTDREDCLLAAFEQAIAYASDRVLVAYGSEKSWRAKVRAALVALLGFLDEEPVIGRLLIVDSFSGGPATLARRSEVVATLTSAIEQGQKEAKASAAPPLTAEGLVGGALSVIHSRLAENDRAPLIDLAGPLMSMIVLPYLGAAAARRELDRPAPHAKAQAPESSKLTADPFKDAGMRLTYRTVRVLIAIDQHPDGSNKTIGDTAGITDQGQISKLLARLERIGLIENTHRYPAKGAPNSWALTERGKRITENIRLNTEGDQSNAENER